MDKRTSLLSFLISTEIIVTVLLTVFKYGSTKLVVRNTNKNFLPINRRSDDYVNSPNTFNHFTRLFNTDKLRPQPPHISSDDQSISQSTLALNDLVNESSISGGCLDLCLDILMSPTPEVYGDNVPWQNDNQATSESIESRFSSPNKREKREESRSKTQPLKVNGLTSAEAKYYKIGKRLPPTSRQQRSIDAAQIPADIQKLKQCLTTLCSLHDISQVISKLTPEKGNQNHERNIPQQQQLREALSIRFKRFAVSDKSAHRRQETDADYSNPDNDHFTKGILEIHDRNSISDLLSKMARQLESRKRHNKKLSIRTAPSMSAVKQQVERVQSSKRTSNPSKQNTITSRYGMSGRRAHSPRRSSMNSIHVGPSLQRNAPKDIKNEQDEDGPTGRRLRYAGTGDLTSFPRRVPTDGKRQDTRKRVFTDSTNACIAVNCAGTRMDSPGYILCRRRCL